MGRDLRQYARQTNLLLVIGFILLLLIVGDGLIFLFFGRYAGVMGLFCIGASLVPVGMIALAFWIIDRIIQANR